MIFDNCICIAQARVIEGKRKKAHICTIAYHQSTDAFLRICLPFERGRETGIRRWHRFSFEGYKQPTDTRTESFEFGRLLSIQSQLVLREKFELHQKILSLYRYEAELNNEKKSIGLLIPEPGSLRFISKPLTEREQEYRSLMKEKGLFFPDYKIHVTGRSAQFKNRFNKQLVQWDLFEAIRKRVDPFPALQSFKNPYIIIGNTPWKRDSFMAISILSAPSKAISHAHFQQLNLVS
jgi:hypothetical protein